MNYKAGVSEILKSIPWFVDFKPRQIDLLSDICVVQSIEVNQELFHEGGREDCLYIVIEGKLAVDIHIPTQGDIRIFNAEPLDIIGWSCMTPVVRQRTASVRALQASQLLCLEAQALHNLCEADHDIGYVIMRRLANVVASRLLTTRLQLLDHFVNPNEESLSLKQISE